MSAPFKEKAATKHSSLSSTSGFNMSPTYIDFSGSARSVPMLRFRLKGSLKAI